MKTVLAVVTVLIIIALCFAWYIGSFTSIKAEDAIEGGYKVVGLEFTGSYSKSGKWMTEVNEKLKNMGLTFSKGFGIYYDNPQTTPSEKCRSFVGNILGEKDFNKISELKSAGFKIDSVARSNSVIAEFPLKSNLSYMVGAMKAYPVLSKYIAEKNLKVTLSIEIYDIPAKKIIYIMQYNK